MPQKKTVLDRALGIVTEVKPGEGGTALLLAFNVFLLLCAYYVIKPVREALILTHSGAEIKAYAALPQVALLAVLVPAYGALASKVSRRMLIPVVTFIFVGCLVLFYFAAMAEMSFIGVVFYLWVGIFNLMIVAQFWSFANDLYTKKQGERLFPVVAFGASSGAVAGSELTSQLVKPIGVEQLMLVSGAILLATVGITRWVEVRERKRGNPAATPEGKPARKGPVQSDPSEDEEKSESPDSRNQPYRSEKGEKPESSEQEEPGGKLGKSGAFALVVRDHYLTLIALLMMLANLVNTTGEYVLGSVVEEVAKQTVSQGQAGGMSVEDFIGEFYADFFFWVNVIGLAMQMFLVSRIIRWIGVRWAVMILPAIAFGSYTVLALFPVLTVVRWMKTAENATDYSLNNTVRNALFLPVSREKKYKAKQAVDTFFVRGGDVLSAGLVFAGTQWLGLGPSGFAWVNTGLALVTLVITFRIGAIYRNRGGPGEAEERNSESGEPSSSDSGRGDGAHA